MAKRNASAYGFGSGKERIRGLENRASERWHAWHSLRLRSRSTGKFGETDFVIADPGKPALLLLEVKGGQIEVRNGLDSAGLVVPMDDKLKE